MKISLRAKTVFAITVIVLFTVAFFHWASYFFLLNSSLKFERNMGEQSVKRAERLIQQAIDEIADQTEDYSMWDDTYAYLHDRNEDYLKVNYISNTFVRLEIDFVIFYDASGQRVYSQGYDHRQDTFSDIPEDILKELEGGNGILLHKPSSTKGLAGILVTPERYAFISSQPILTSYGEGPAAGSLIMGQYLGDEEFSKIPEYYDMELDLLRNDGSIVSGGEIVVMPVMEQGRNSSEKGPAKEAVYGYKSIKDVFGNDSLVLCAKISRDYYEQAESSFFTFMLITTAAMLLFGMVILLLLGRTVLFPVWSLRSSILAISESKNLSDRIPVKGTDEISDLAHSVNRLLEELEKNERQKAYLRSYDRLTGLYNRTYFEQELMEREESGNVPISLIIGDVNGLKVTNDLFGHEEGDRLLRELAGIIKECCREGDVIARWGGDEFAVLLAGAAEDVAIQVCERIRKACLTCEGFPAQPTISLGSATKKEPAENLLSLVNEAEDRLYRHKLLESRSNRSSVISTLSKALFEKNYETEEHAKRMVNLSLRMGRELGLAATELDEIGLVSLLHDIGKIAIPHNILMKPGKLTEEEMEEMKKHTEIGFRIAESVRELSHISKYILYHHERWDGKGYPHCLKGNAIPKLSRIVSIVDAYDVMTHARPYKTAVSREEAMEEIRRCSGTQFDPQLVEVFMKIMTES